MKIQVKTSPQIAKEIQSLSEDARFAFSECKNRLENELRLPEEVFLGLAGYSIVWLKTGEGLILTRQQKKPWGKFGETIHLIIITHLISAERMQNFLMKEYLNAQDNLEDDNSSNLGKLAINSLDQAGRFDIVLKLMPIFVGLILTVLMLTVKPVGLADILNPQNRLPSNPHYPQKPDNQSNLSPPFGKIIKIVL